MDGLEAVAAALEAEHQVVLERMRVEAGRLRAMGERVIARAAEWEARIEALSRPLGLVEKEGEGTAQHGDTEARSDDGDAGVGDGVGGGAGGVGEVPEGVAGGELTFTPEGEWLRRLEVVERVAGHVFGVEGERAVRMTAGRRCLAVVLSRAGWPVERCCELLGLKEAAFAVALRDGLRLEREDPWHKRQVGRIAEEASEVLSCQ